MPTRDELRAWIEQHVGLDWLARTANASHPFRVAWNWSKGGAPTSTLSEHTDVPRVVNFAATLEKLVEFPTRRPDGGTLADTAFRTLLISRASTSIAEFDSAEVEAFTAYAYRHVLDREICAIGVSPASSPDFEITVEEAPVSIECKARTTAPPDHRAIERVRREFLTRLGPLVHRAAAGYGVSLTFTEPPATDAIWPLAERLEAALETGSEFEWVEGALTVRAKILLKPGQELITPTAEPLGRIAHAPEPIRSFLLSNGMTSSSTYAGTDFRCQARVDPGSGQYFLRKPTLLVVHFDIVPDHVKATVELMRKARRQLSRTQAGVVVIRAPQFYGLDQFQRVGEGLGKTLRSSTTISGILLVHQVVDKQAFQSGDMTGRLFWQLIWVRNGRARKPLPESFEVSHIPRSDGIVVARLMSTTAKPPETITKPPST